MDKPICVTKEYILMLINLLKQDGQDTKKIVKSKLEGLIK